MPVWQRNLDALAEHHRVVAIDLPGYGKSSKANYDYSMAFYARTVEGVIDALGLGRVVLVGHSMGGQIALTHALRYPGRAEALVLVSPAGFERFGAGEGAWLAEAVNKDYVARTPAEAVYANVANNFYSMPKEARFMVDDRLRVIGGPDFDAYTYAVARSVYAMVHEPVLDRLGRDQGADAGRVRRRRRTDSESDSARRHDAGCRRRGDAAPAAGAVGDDSARRPHGPVRAARPVRRGAARVLEGDPMKKPTLLLVAVLAFASAPSLAQAQALTQVTDFGSNPGGLRMWKYVPSGMPQNAPLVLALHACSQQAADYVKAGWNTLADQYKFYVALSRADDHE